MRMVAMLALAVSAAGPAFAQWKYPGCADLDATQFKFTELFNRHATLGAAAGDESMEEPVQFALQGVNKAGTEALDHVDIYFVQRLGGVKYYDGAAKKIGDMGEIPVWAAVTGGSNDNGLMGIALDPAFAKNRWMYLWYAPPIANKNLNRRLHLGRFTVTAQNTLDMKSEKVIIDMLASKNDHWHSGGPMEFDAYGDLWIQIGNNSDDVDDSLFTQYSKDSSSNDEWGAGNTASMRGGTIRIHPDDSPKGYSIPKGNFGEYWAAEWEKKGRADLAAEYRNPAKVLPEIYIKGERSNYSIALHPTKRWLAWGTVNFQSSRDEFNIAAHPEFTGFPYFHADNERVPGQQQMLGKLEDPAAPMNNSALSSGVHELPPAVPGTVNSLVPVAIGGPIYLYNPANPSRSKFPPHLHNSWIGFDWKQSQMHVFGLDTNTLTVTTKTRLDNGLFKGIGLRGPLGAHYGPDGALYLLNYDGSYSTFNPGITRVEYTGTCLPSGDAIRADAAQRFNIVLTPTALEVRESGPHAFALFDHAGRRLLDLRGVQGARYDFVALRSRAGLKPGLYLTRVETAAGVYIRRVSFL